MRLVTSKWWTKNGTLTGHRSRSGTFASLQNRHTKANLAKKPASFSDKRGTGFNLDRRDTLRDLVQQIQGIYKTRDFCFAGWLIFIHHSVRLSASVGVERITLSKRI